MSRRPWAVGFVLACASAVGGFMLLAPVPALRGGVPDPLSLVGPQVVQARLQEGGAFEAELSNDLQPPPSGGRMQLTFWSQPNYSGPIDDASVRRLVENGKAAALEFRLGASARAELRRDLGSTDETMRDLGLLIAAQEDMIKEKLRGDRERTIVLSAKPPVADARFPETLRLRQQIKYDTGTVWLQPYPEGEVHFIVRWEHWPGLKALYDDRFALIGQRQERARRCIESLLHRDGNKVFD